MALRYARRPLRLTAMVGRLAITLAGRAGAAVLSGLGVAVSRSTVLRVLMALPIPSVMKSFWRTLQLDARVTTRIATVTRAPGVAG